MTEMTVLAATKREQIGTGPARSLRRAGTVPATIYGEGGTPLSIIIQEKEITKLYHRHGFTSTVLAIELDGKVIKVLPKAIQLHPITDLVSHVDFVYLAKEQQKVEVPLVFEGKERAVGIKRGGFFNIIFRKVTLNCPVNSIPQDIVIDVTNMGIGSSIVASKLKLPAGCTLACKSSLVIASITGRGGKADATENAAEGEEAATAA